MRRSTRRRGGTAQRATKTKPSLPNGGVYKESKLYVINGKHRAHDALERDDPGVLGRRTPRERHHAELRSLLELGEDVALLDDGDVVVVPRQAHRLELVALAHGLARARDGDVDREPVDANDDRVAVHLVVRVVQVAPERAARLDRHVELDRQGHLVAADAKRDASPRAVGKGGEPVVRAGVADVREQDALAQTPGGEAEHLAQDVGIPARGAGGHVVAGVRDERGSLRRPERHAQGLIGRGCEAGVVELAAALPDVFGELVGLALAVPLVRGGLGHHDDAAASHVGVVADVAYVPGRGSHARVPLHLVHVGVDAPDWLVRRDGLLTTKDEGELAVDRVDVLPLAQEVAQPSRHSAQGGDAVGVGALPVGADERRGLGVLPAHVPVGVAHHEDGQVLAHHPADGRQDVVVARAQALDLAGAVEHEQHAVDLADVLARAPHELPLDVVKGVALDDARGAGVRQDGGDRLHAFPLEHIAQVHRFEALVAVHELEGAQVVPEGDVRVGLRDELPDHDLHGRSPFHTAASHRYQMLSIGNIGRMMRLSGSLAVF